MDNKSFDIASSFQRKIEQLMDVEKQYRNPKIGLSDFGCLTGISTRAVSKLIRQHYDKNFPDFLNSYRLNEVLHRFHMNHHRKHTIMGLALEAGFTSKSTFYRYFNKKLRVSPSIFLQRRKME